MGLISELLGSIRAGGKPAKRTIADVEGALSRLSNERTAARAALAATMHERDDLLLVDGSDARIAELDGTADRHRLTLERCDKLEPVLFAELEALRSEAKAAKWRDLRARYDAAALDYAETLRDAVAKMATMLNLNDEARRAGFEHEVASAFTPPTRMISVDALNDFEAAAERARELARPAAPAVVKAAVPAPAPAPVKAAAPVKPSPPRKARELRRIMRPVADGNMGITILRAGVEIGGEQHGIGDEVALSKADAMKLLRSGAATTIEEGATL